jgi:CO/xanthine dehydrogenase FAD-binding subunit
MSVDVLIPESEAEAVEAYGDGSGITVLGGGTSVMQLLNYQRLHPAKVLLLSKAGLTYVNLPAHEKGHLGAHYGGEAIVIGATTPLSDLTAFSAPLGPCALNVADAEIRSQATLGGNLCSPTPPEHPSGDLQGALMALDAQVRSTGADGERIDSVEDFLPERASRLVLDVAFHEPAAGAFAAFRRLHAHHFTPLAVSGVTTKSGDARLAVTGAGDTAVRLVSAEAAADDPEAAGQAALGDVTLSDDAVLSAWYRERLLPTLVKRVLDEMKGGG